MNGKLTATLSARGRLKATLSKAIERVEPIIKPLEITENGEYSAPETVHGFNPVNVNVPIRYEEGYADGYNEGYQASQDSITLQEKTATENGEVVTDEGFTGMSKVIVAVPIKEEQEKTVEITENGTVEVTPDENKVLSKVTVNTNVKPDNIGKPYIDTGKMTSFERFFYYGANLEMLDYIDTSNATIFNYMFNGCNALKTIPLLDISNGTSFNYAFAYCIKLETVSLTTAKGNLSTNTFQNCTALKNITIGEGWNVNIYLHYSNNLTVESLHGMIENLADLTGQTAKTFQIGATNLAKIDEEHINMLKAKNWNYS